MTSRLVVALTGASLGFLVCWWFDWPECDGGLRRQAFAVVKEAEVRWKKEGWVNVTLSDEHSLAGSWRVVFQPDLPDTKRDLEVVVPCDGRAAHVVAGER